MVARAFSCVVVCMSWALVSSFVYKSHLIRSTLLSMATALDTKCEPDNFVRLKSLEDRTARLSNLESEFMLTFWSDQLQSFQILPQIKTNRVSVTTTCIALKAIQENPAHWQSRAAWDSNNDGKISIKNAINQIISTAWSGDLFQTQAVVLTLAKFKACDKDYSRYLEAVEKVLDNRPKLSNHRDHPNSSYLRYMNVHALQSVVNHNMVPTVIQGSHRIGFALERANLVAFDELCRQLAFHNSGDSANFDVITLGYSLLSYWETSNSMLLSSFARGVVPVTNLKLVKSALDIIFAQQANDGTWEKGEPINKVGDIKGGRDIGNNYVFFFDLIASLLSSIGSKQPQLLAPYLENFARCLEWAEANIQQEMLPDRIDETTGRSVGTVIKGWRSNHLGTGGAVAWCTAQVFSALTSFRSLLRQLITETILTEFGGRVAASTPTPRDFTNLMDSDLELAGQRTTLKEILLERMLTPMAVKESAVDNFLSSKSVASATKSIVDATDSIAETYPPLYSAILFGPPGTAKTTICTSLANYLGWNFLTIDTAAFLADGLENIAARMAYIFTRLNSLQRTLILFDEIEEFCLDRENPNLGMESRMLTTAMLTQLNELRRKQSSIFIVATNRLRSFDAAVIRPGRFDMLVFVGTPNLSARIQRLKGKLQSAGLTTEKQALALQLTEKYLESHWSEARFLSFAENESLLSAVTEQSVRGVLTEASVADKVTALLRTATIQGAVRTEFEASEQLSRL